MSITSFFCFSKLSLPLSLIYLSVSIISWKQLLSIITIFDFDLPPLSSILMSLAKILEKDPYSSSFYILRRKDFPFFDEVEILLGYSRITDDDCIFWDKFTEDFCFLFSCIDLDCCLVCPCFLPLVFRSNTLSWFLLLALVLFWEDPIFLEVFMETASS